MSREARKLISALRKDGFATLVASESGMRLGEVLDALERALDERDQLLARVERLERELRERTP